MIINGSTQHTWRSADGRPLRGQQAREAIDSFRPHQSQSHEELHHGFVQTQKGARLFGWHRTRLRERVKLANTVMLGGFAAVAAAPVLNGPAGVALLVTGSALTLASMYVGFNASSQAGEADSFARELQHKADLYLRLDHRPPPTDSPSPSEVDHARRLMNEVGTKVLRLQELDGSRWDLDPGEGQVRVEARPAGLTHNQYLEGQYHQSPDGSQQVQARLRSGRAEYGYHFDAASGDETYTVVRQNLPCKRVEVKPGGLPVLHSC